MGILMKMAESRAIKKIAMQMPPILASSYGYSETYTSGPVAAAINAFNKRIIVHLLRILGFRSGVSRLHYGPICGRHV